MRNDYFLATEIAGGITRRGVLWRGVFLTLTGILIALEPLLATFTMSILFGSGLTCWGLWILTGAFRLEKRRWAWGIYGILLTVGGVLLLLNPAAELIAFAWSVAMLLLSGGVIGISVCLAAGNSSMQNISCFITSICSILLGSLLFIFPVAGMAELFWVLGILLVLEGISLIVVSFRIPARPAAEKETPRPAAS